MLKGNSDKKKFGFRCLYQDFDYFRLDFLGEFEAIFETALANKSGPSGGLFDEKNRGSKIS
jgi:hypothetical protein